MGCLGNSHTQFIAYMRKIPHLHLIIDIFAKYLYIKKMRFVIFKFNFLDFQHLRNRYAKVHLVLFIIITQWRFILNNFDEYQWLFLFFVFFWLNLLWIILCLTLVIGTVVRFGSTWDAQKGLDLGLPWMVFSYFGWFFWIFNDNIIKIFNNTFFA